MYLRRPAGMRRAATAATLSLGMERSGHVRPQRTRPSVSLPGGLRWGKGSPRGCFSGMRMVMVTLYMVE